MTNKITNDVIELIGNTPLIRLNNIVDKTKSAEILGKLESFNPGGSVKDRPCLEMIKDAQERNYSSTLGKPSASPQLIQPRFYEIFKNLQADFNRRVQSKGDYRGVV